jgi:hypothetical protein
MSRTILPFAADDVSALARSLGRELQSTDSRPGHVQLLNMLARAAGYRNFQHFRADHTARTRLDAPAAPAPADPIDHARLERVARRFGPDGALIGWPTKASHRELCIWALWSRLPRNEPMSEPEINRRLQAMDRTGDHVSLRRWLVDYGLVQRTTDGREYRRTERRPPAEVLAFIRALKLQVG